jgi:hypothetical protein
MKPERYSSVAKYRSATSQHTELHKFFLHAFFKKSTMVIDQKCKYDNK